METNILVTDKLQLYVITVVSEKAQNNYKNIENLENE